MIVHHNMMIVFPQFTRTCSLLLFDKCHCLITSLDQNFNLFFCENCPGHSILLFLGISSNQRSILLEHHRRFFSLLWIFQSYNRSLTCFDSLDVAKIQRKLSEFFGVEIGFLTRKFSGVGVGFRSQNF